MVLENTAEVTLNQKKRNRNCNDEFRIITITILIFSTFHIYFNGYIYEVQSLFYELVLIFLTAF